MLPYTQIKLVILSMLISTASFGQTSIINETFSSSSLPSGWTNTETAGSNKYWAFNNPGNRTINTGNFSGGFAIVDSDLYGSGSSQYTYLTTPSFDSYLYTTITLSYDFQYKTYTNTEFCLVQVYNGSSWVTVKTYNSNTQNHPNTTRVSIDLTNTVQGALNAKVRFVYKSTWGYWFALDNVKITGVEPALAANPKGPGGIGTKDGTSSLSAWYTPENLRDASSNLPSDNETVKYWIDASGNNKTITNSGNAKFQTSNSDLINGYPKMVGTSLNRQFKTSSTVNGRTIIVVTNPGTGNSFEPVVGFNQDKGIRRSAGGYNKWQHPGGGDGVNNDTWSTNSGTSYVNGSTSNTGSFGNTLHFISQTRPSNFSNTFYVGGYYHNRTFTGSISEIIVFKEALSLVEKIILDNYLSAKYAISIAGSGANYYTQDNVAAGNFDYNVAGIGRATDGSIHNNSQGTGIIKINNPSQLGVDEFLFWGENTLNATYEFGTNSTDYMDRLNSTWRVSMRNDLGTVSVSVAAADLNLSNKQSCAPLKLVVASQSNFSNKTTYDLSLVNGVYTAINVDFDDGDYFTFEYQDVIAVDNSRFYNGSGSSSSPNNSDVCYKLLVKNTADGSFNLGQDATVREVEIETGGIFTINSGFTLISDGDIINNGTVTVEENGSIIQNTTGTNNNSGSGNYIVSRTGNTNPYVYNIWSSPISNANSVGIFNNSNPCDIWVFDRISQSWSYDFPAGFSTQCNGNNVTFTANDVVAGGDGLMDICGGYFVPGNTASTKTYDGTVNNGDYLKPISTTNLGNPGGTDWGDDDWNLLGNPYPSGLSAAAFWTENAINNSRITDALYFWDEADTTNGYNQNSDYASWNMLGGVNSGNSNKIPNGNIASGQGFWVVANSNSNVVFNNSMRSGSNSQYFKTNNAITNHVAWVGVTSPSGYKNNVLVGYNDISTDGVDVNFDAHKLPGNSHIRLATTINGEEFSIQGFEKLTLGDAKTIPLNLFTDETGVHTFDVYKRENMPASTKVYIRDLLLGTTQDLSQGGYTVALTGNQTYSNRFELVFERTISSNNDHSWVKNSPSNVTSITDVNETSKYILQKSENGYTLSNADGIKGDMKVMDVTGKVVWSKTKVNATHVNINFENVSSGFYFVQIIQGKERVYQNKLMNP